jgi:alcohol dehydrogenase YqhD (iron-dependent ADH family)
MVFGKSLESLEEYARPYGKIILVTGRESMKRLGLTDRMTGILSGKDILLYDKIEPNPRLQNG